MLVNFDETWYTSSSLYDLKYFRGKYTLTKALGAEWGKVSKIHVISRPIEMLDDFDETQYTCSSLADLKYCRGNAVRVPGTPDGVARRGSAQHDSTSQHLSGTEFSQPTRHQTPQMQAQL
ncbi:hypothetical protein AVEN_230498-1 [Araneus ventricosus]|uniref:Uncharacterized protein n=1 Tax=Araneus ventricosus TaxID=182803 RepID=A0A4Y2IEI0_ARAVE|nr:hypothetical protein AVEN_230498-1 [Araneus ventricosus]